MVSTPVRIYLGPESACELGAGICNYVVRVAARADEQSNEKTGQFRQVNILPAHEVDCQHYQSVHDNKNPGAA